MSHQTARPPHEATWAPADTPMQTHIWPLTSDLIHSQRILGRGCRGQDGSEDQFTDWLEGALLKKGVPRQGLPQEPGPAGRGAASTQPWGPTASANKPRGAVWPARAALDPERIPPREQAGVTHRCGLWAPGTHRPSSSSSALSVCPQIPPGTIKKTDLTGVLRGGVTVNSSSF